MALACLSSACAPGIPATPAPTASPVPSAAPAPTAAAAAVDVGVALDTALKRLTQAGLFSGSVLVARNGHVILSQGYGYADQAKKTPNTAQTKFRLYSVTKQFTAMAIMLLQERG